MRGRYLCGVSCAALLFAADATAQQAAQATAGTTADPAAQQSGLEEIVVTAQRRSQRLQDVPVAVTAVSGDSIKSSGYQSITDLQYLVPSVQYNTANGGGFQIRGVGTQTFSYSADQTVGIMIDDVVLGIPRDPGPNSLTDIDHVEVLSGPQGTLFGKNTSAGVITITTKKPIMGEWMADGHFSYGTDNETIGQANLNIPLGDTVAARLSGYIRHRDGFVRNVLLNADMSGVNDIGFRGKLRWQPTDDLDIYVIGSYQRSQNTNAGTLRSYGPGPSKIIGFYQPSALPFVSPVAQNAPYGIVVGPDNLQLADAGLSGHQFHVHAGSVEANYQLGDHTLTSVTGYRVFVQQGADPSDFVPANLLDINAQAEHASQLTQEIRLASPSGGFVEYVLGLYYYDMNVHARGLQAGTFGLPNLRLFGLPYGPIYSSLGGQTHFDDESRSYAAFGQGTIHLTDDLRLIVGARYTHDELDAAAYTTHYAGVDPFPGGKLSAPSAAATKHNNISVHAGLQYNFTPDIMAYATFATGYKGPAISTAGGKSLPVRPETSDDYELGLKSQLLERRLIVNLSAFYEKYHDFQAQVFDTGLTPAQFVFSNAGGLKSMGFEAQITGQVTDELTLSANASYAYTKYLEFSGQCYIGQPLSSTVGSGCYKDPTTNQFIANLAGNPLPLAPRWSYTLNASYHHPVLDGFVFDAEASYIWKQDSYSAVGDPNTISGSYGLVGLNLGLSPEDGKWRVGVFARNLLDQHFQTAIIANYFDPGGYLQSQTAEARRTVGLVLDFSI